MHGHHQPTTNRRRGRPWTEVDHEWVINEGIRNHLRAATLSVPHRVIPILPLLFDAYLAAWRSDNGLAGGARLAAIAAQQRERRRVISDRLRNQTRPGRCRFGLRVRQRSTWPWVWPGWPDGSDEAFADGRCECKRREDLRHRDLTALSLGYPRGRVGTR
jgi:hypothetical protein